MGKIIDPFPALHGPAKSPLSRNIFSPFFIERDAMRYRPKLLLSSILAG